MMIIFSPPAIDSFVRLHPVDLRRWCITYQGGKSGRNGSRQSCFGRIWFDEVQPTVVTRAEPHNLRIVHPTEDRVLSIRENERSQVGGWGIRDDGQDQGDAGAFKATERNEGGSITLLSPCECTHFMPIAKIGQIARRMYKR